MWQKIVAPLGPITYVGMVLFEEKKTRQTSKTLTTMVEPFARSSGMAVANEPISLWYYCCDGFPEGAVEGFWLNICKLAEKKIK